MTPDLVLGIDCSTTAVKAIVWDPCGTPQAQGRSPLHVSSPFPGWGEQNPEDWWAATSDAVRQAVASVDGRRIAALAVAHQRETFACVAEDGRPVRPAICWLDTRAWKQVEDFGSADIHARTGKPPNTTPAWYKLRWLSVHEPEVLRRSQRIVDVQAYLVHRLTGAWHTSTGSADPLGLLDMLSFEWDEGLLADAGIDLARMAEIGQPGTVVAEVTAGVADELGLPAAVPVVLGIGDGQAAALGTDTTRSGRTYINLGSGVISGAHSDTYRWSDAFRSMTSAVAGAYMLETFIGGGTLNVSWFVDRFAGIDAGRLGIDLSTEQVLDAAASRIPPGSDRLLVLPHMTGALTPHWDHRASGVIVGLRDHHGKAHVFRAMLEGLAFEQRLLTEGVEAALDTPMDDVILLGGGSRSAVWCQIMADVLRRPARRAGESETTCLGAAMLAAAGAGLHPSVRAAAAGMASGGPTYEPDDGASKRYDQLFAVYRQLYPALRSTFSQLEEGRA